MTRDSGKDAKTASVVDNFMPKNNYHPLLGFYVHHSRRKYFMIVFGIATLSSLLIFGLTSAIASSRQVKVTVAIPSTTIAVPTPTSTPTISNNFSGQVALTEVQLRAEIRQVDDLIFWAGAMAGARYTFTHDELGQGLIRYLPNGQGLADSTFIYRIIATYKSTTAYDSILAAGKSKSTVVIINSDGSVVYYQKARPTNVFIVFKGLDYQIEIFDPTLGTSLKLATTPGAIVPLF